MRGLIFTTELVPKVLDRTKTVTRRRMNPQPVYELGMWVWKPRKYTIVEQCNWAHFAPYKSGEIRYLKEAIQRDAALGDSIYVADNAPVYRNHRFGEFLKWRWKKHFLTGMFLPEEASRAKLEIKGVRAEQVQDITYDDILLEGWDPRKSKPMTDRTAGEDARDWYAALWDRINGKGSWAKNEWPWRIEFERTEAE